jgi:hypothetical protein
MSRAALLASDLMPISAVLLIVARPSIARQSSAAADRAVAGVPIGPARNATSAG